MDRRVKRGARRVISVLGALWNLYLAWGPAPARAAVLLDLPEVTLWADTADQAFDLYLVSDAVMAINGIGLNLQVADGGPAAGGLQAGPAITQVDLLTGTLFAGNNNGLSGSGSIVPQVYEVGTLTASGTVTVPVGSTKVARVTLDTRGFDGGTYRLTLNTLNGPTKLTTLTGDYLPPLLDGSVTLVAPPESNQAPRFTPGPNVQVAQTAVPSPSTQLQWANNISAGAPSETGQLLNFILAVDLPGMFAVLPAIDPAGTLTFTPGPNLRGTATVTVRLHDNGGTAHGGQDTSPAQTFTITLGLVTDSNGNGLPDDWEAAYGLSALGPNAGNLDSDGDGFTNAQELAAGTDPTKATDALMIAPAPEPTSGQMSVSFLSVPGKRYRLERNDDYPGGPWNIVADNLVGTGEMLHILDAGTNLLSQGIYRVVVLP